MAIEWHRQITIIYLRSFLTSTSHQQCAWAVTYLFKVTSHLDPTPTVCVSRYLLNQGHFSPRPHTSSVPFESPVSRSPFSANAKQVTNFGLSCFWNKTKTCNRIEIQAVNFKLEALLIDTYSRRFNPSSRDHPGRLGAVNLGSFVSVD